MFRCSRSVHPRSRGEHPTAADRIHEASGSSPLARGTRCRPSGRQGDQRFIPARAGNTSSSRSGRPRRGGSSPLARGTQPALTWITLVPRFIPARAGNTSKSRSARSGATVHPRSRGEHRKSARFRYVDNGSSPLARGTHRGRAESAAEHRFIPARAGNTRALPPGVPCPPVHPRSRGEHCVMRTREVRAAGSSPLARGTPIEGGVDLRELRFIPARAGNTAAVPRPPRRHSVHPRSRGEHAVRAVDGCGGAGSSPLARGTPALRVALRHLDRFIPARAGNTRPRGNPDQSNAVHPRSRGGTHSDGGIGAVQQRFIPARAGNTASRGSGRPSSAVHPRSRGEHPLPGGAGAAAVGSSPLARGTHAHGTIPAAPGRFIPARAGNTAPPQAARSAGTVHPRSRGEHWVWFPRMGLPSGSSPLARGTLEERNQPVRGGRFIPARAGNTGSSGCI